MRKILVLALAMAWWPLWGQTPVADSTRRALPADSIAVDDDEPNVIGARTAPHRPQSEANVIGTPIYYDLNGNVIGTGNRPSGNRHTSAQTYHMPKHHYLNNVGLNFNSFFLEMETIVGDHRIALGANFTYLPERWGIYGSAVGNARHTYYSVGPALRLSGVNSNLDWHLYGGLFFGGRHIGGEGGIRLAGPSRAGKFCWASTSLGVAVADNHAFLTVGLSLEVAALSTLSVLIW